MKKTQEPRSSKLVEKNPTIKKVWNSMNARFRRVEGQTFNLPSMTIPDQTMSMRTIVERYAKGMTSDIQKVPIYDDDGSSSGIDPRRLDLVDQEEMQRKNAQTITDLEKQVKKERKQRDQEEADRRQKQLEFEEEQAEFKKFKSRIKPDTNGGGTNNT